MIPHISGSSLSSLSAQDRYAASTREFLEAQSNSTAPKGS